MYSLKVRNFQSIESQDFEFQGFVCITGPSNLGKSSLRRAFSSVCFNDWDPTYQRNHWLGKDANKTVVQFAKPSEELKIKMVKSEYAGDNQFTLTTHLGEQSFNKVGRSIPEEISSQGFELLKTDDDAFNLQVTGQHDPMFMVAFNAPTNTKILNKVFKVSKIELASSLVTKDHRKVKIDATRRTEEYNKKYSELKSIEEKFESQEQLVARAEELLDSIEKAEDFSEAILSEAEHNSSLTRNLEALNLLQHRYAQLCTLKQLLEYLDAVQMKQDLDAKESSLTSRILPLEEIKKKAPQVIRASDFLEAEASLAYASTALDNRKAEQAPLEKSHSLLTQAQTVTTFIKEYDALHEAEVNLKGLARHDDFVSRWPANRSLCNHLYHRENLERIESSLIRLSEQDGVLRAKLEGLNSLSTLEEYFSCLRSCEDASTRIKGLGSNIEELHKELESMPRCGECGQLLTSEHLKDH